MEQAEEQLEKIRPKNMKFDDVLRLRGGLDGFDPRFFVAFANSEKGGTMIIRIANKQGVKTINALTRMAEECIPPVTFDIRVENKDENQYICIDVPSGQNKPYCTSTGQYVIRSNEYFRALQPAELSTIYQKKYGGNSTINIKGFEQVIDIIGSVEQYVYENNVQTDKRFGRLNLVLDAILDKLGVDDPLLDDKKENIQRDGTLLFMMGQTIEEATSEMKKQYPYLKERLIEKWLLESHSMFSSE